MLRLDIQRLSFLIVDDNAHMRRIIRTLLHGFGGRDIHEAADGPSGLEAFNAHVPDILLTERVMPIFGGLELTEMIRQSEDSANPFAPIIMISSRSDRAHVTAARDAGVTEFLAKPISAKALYQRLVHVVSSPRPFIKTRSYFGPDRRRSTNSNYTGPERRIGDKAEVTRQRPLLVNAKPPD